MPRPYPTFHNIQSVYAYEPRPFTAALRLLGTDGRAIQLNFPIMVKSVGEAKFETTYD